MKNRVNFFASIYIITYYLASSPVYGIDTPEIKYSQPPGWVESISFSEDNLKNVSEITFGSYYLLVDHQTNVIKDRYRYKHYAIKLLNETAVEDNSRITINFSPIYQKLVIHKVTIWRNGEPINQPVKNKIKLLQREQELENQIYDGRWSATLLLEDVRKADTLEYSYSIIGQNPAYKNNISERVYIQWTVPVGRQVYRLLWPDKLSANVTVADSYKDKIKVNEYSGYREYRLDYTNYKTVQIDSETPEWFDPWQWVSFSSIKEWKDVVSWGQEHYRLGLEKNSEVKDLAEKFRADFKTKIEQASAALHFVQDEVRYVGIEVGTGGFIPSKVDVTLKRRYGDCKDKTYLLLAILKMLDIEAYPVFANNRDGEKLGEYGPRLNAFNHVLVKTIIDGKSYWLETTTNNQAGTIDKIYQPEYGQVLVLKSGNNELTTMNVDNSYHKTILNEEFDLTKGVNKDVLYTVKTVLTGNDAEIFRRNINSKGKKKLSKEYLDYYTKYYDNILAIEDFVINDNKIINKINIVEKYKITGMWEDNKEERSYYAYFYSNSISPYLTKPKVRKRISPYLYSNLLNYEQNINILLPGSWSIKNSNSEHLTQFFNFTQKIIYNKENNILLLKYNFQSLKKYIKAGEIDDYIKAIDSAKKDVDFSIYSSYINEHGLYNINYHSPIVIILIIIIVIILLFSYYYTVYRKDGSRP